MSQWTAEDVARHNAKLGAKMPAHVPARAAKYHNTKTTVDGIVFDSAKEAKRYYFLKMRQLAGEIYGLERQVSYDLIVNGMLICRYVCDARYIENQQVVVEDVKGGNMKTPVYRLKKKLMQALYQITILET